MAQQTPHVVVVHARAHAPVYISFPYSYLGTIETNSSCSGPPGVKATSKLFCSLHGCIFFLS
jgi:hypothetical protein